MSHSPSDQVQPAAIQKTRGPLRGRRHHRGLSLPGTTLAFILGTLVLTYGLQDAARERDDRHAVAIGALLHDQAEAFDSFQHEFIATAAQTTPTYLTTPTTFPMAADGLLAPGSDLQPPYRRTVAYRDRRISAFTVPVPGETQPLGVLIVTLAADEKYLLPRIIAWLDARGALETKAWRGDVLPWLRSTGLVTDPEADFAFFTAPHASINPDILRRAPRSGWPTQAMSANLQFQGPASLCATIDRAATPPTCSEVERVEAASVEASSATIAAPLTLDSLATSALAAASATVDDLTAQRGSFTRLSSPAGSIATVSTLTAAVSSTRPAGGLTYAASFARLETPNLETTLLATENSLTSTLPITTRFLTADLIRRRNGAALPSLTFTTLTTQTTGSNTARINTGRITSCIGCP